MVQLWQWVSFRLIKTGHGFLMEPSSHRQHRFYVVFQWIRCAYGGISLGSVGAYIHRPVGVQIAYCTAHGTPAGAARAYTSSDLRGYLIEVSVRADPATTATCFNFVVQQGLFLLLSLFC